MSEEFSTGVNPNQEAFPVLRYPDPNGDTTFSRLQLQDLLRDLTRLLTIEPNPLGEALIALATQCRAEVHTYVCFYGD